MHAPLSIKNLNRIAGLLTLLLVAYAAATAWYSWADEKTEALRDMATIMEMEARAFDNYFSHLELALKGLGDDLSRDGERIDLDRAYVLVRKFHDLYPELYNVTLIQADGTVLLTARNPPRTVHVTLAGEASFIHFVDAVAQGQLFDIGRPLLAKINKVVIVPVRHAIKDRQGKLGYIVSANLTHEHLQSYWIDSPLTARAAAIGLIRDSGFLLSRYPVPADLTLDQIYGVPRTGALIHHLQQQGFPERGYVEGPSSLDGPDFLTAFRRLPTHPLTLFIAMPLSEIRAAWWRRVSSTGFALLLLFGGGFTAYRDALRRQRAWDIEDQRLKDAQQQSERRLRSIIEALPVPTVISDAQHNLTYVNAAFTTAFGYQQRELPSLAEWWVRACPDLQYRQSVLDTWYARMAGLRSHAAPSQALEVQVTTKRGERRTLLTTMSLLALPHDGSHLTTWYDITQRKAMETLLADREQHLELALAGAAMGTWEWVVPSGVLRFSARWAALQGYTLEELPRRIESWATRVFPDDLPLVRERLDRHLKGETTDYESEHRLLHKNGHWVWVLARGKVVERDGAGEPVRVMGITFDITERKQTEAQLETLLREQRAILDSPVVGIVKVKARVIVWANAAFARMLGYSPEELIGQPTRIAYPNDESYEAFGQLVYPILARGEVLRTELQQRRKDGTLGWYEIGTGRLGLENGEALGAFVDISQRKSAELALRASEERLRIIFQSMAEGLVLQCRDGRIVDANPAAEALLGLGREQLLGKTSVDPQWCAIREDGTPFPGDEHPGMVTLRTGKSLRHQIMGIKAPGHGLRWISINSQPVFADEQGLPVQVIATFVDVTERRLAEAEILSTKNQLQATLDAIPDVLFEVGVDGRIHNYHAQRSDPMETSTNGFVGKTLFAVLPADAAEVCIDAIRVAVDKGGSTGHAYRLSLPQGERWFELSAAPMAAAAGQVQRVIVLSRDITERKRLEAQLLASAREIEDLYDHAPCGYHSVGPDGIYLQINATELAWLGYRRDEVVGRMTPADFLTPTGRTLFEQMFPSLKNEGQVNNLEFELVARNGSLRQVSISATSVRDADGSFLMSRSVMFDITEIKDLQSRMQQLLIEQQALLDNGLVGIMTTSDRTIVWANRALENMLGYGRGELSGRPTQAGYPSAQAYADFSTAAYPVLQAGGVFRTQVECVRKDGAPIWLDVSGARLESHAGDSLWCFVDITERVRQEHQLEAQRWHLQNIVDGTRAGTWEWNVETGECVANELLAQMAGYTLQELAPLSIRTWERLIHPDDRELSARLLDGYLAGELPYYEYEGRVHHKDGHWVWVLVRGKVSQWSTDGRPLLLSGTHQDISAQKQNEAMLEAARLQAEAASVAKSRFLATMSHEIRTPMHAILGMAQMLQVPGLDESRRQDYARIVLNSGQALLALLNDILDTSKIEAGSIELESVALRPREILDDTQMLYSEAIHQKGLRFASEWSGPAAQRYLGDPYRLRQMLANLLGNAVKFTEQGRIQLAARELERDATTAVLEFSVSDTGIGIPQDKQQDLFLPFAQADTSTTRQYGGTGLGLSIVSSLAKQMHGEVGVESEVGRGSRFWFRLRAGLPVAGGDGPVEARYEPSPLAARPTQMLGRVLVVDDSRSSRKVIEAMLNTLGLSVVMAENGQQAVDAYLRGEAADLVLMDLHMPVMDGYDAAVRIRRWEVENAQPRHPIIALTADVKDENRQRCLAVDMDDFLCKPLVIDTLAATLGRYLPSAATASQIPAPRAVDPLRIAALLGELEVLLVEGKFDAVGCFRSLQEAVAGTELAAELTETGRLLAEVRFDLALGELRRVAAAQGWRNKT